MKLPFDVINIQNGMEAWLKLVFDVDNALNCFIVHFIHYFFRFLHHIIHKCCLIYMTKYMTK